MDFHRFFGIGFALVLVGNIVKYVDDLNKKKGVENVMDYNDDQNNEYEVDTTIQDSDIMRNGRTSAERNTLSGLSDLFEEESNDLSSEIKNAKREQYDVGKDIREWIQKSPVLREEEVKWLLSFNPELKASVSNSGNLQKPIMVNKWMFLMILDKTFPKNTENGDVPISVYFVSPNVEEIKDEYGLSKLKGVERMKDGSDRLLLKGLSKEIEEYHFGQSSEELLTEKVVKHVADWIASLNEMKSAEGNKSKRSKGFGQGNFGLLNRNLTSSFERRSKYVDARKDFCDEINPKCKKVVLSNRAFTQIYSETYSKYHTETGGLLIGHFENGVWYVVEASDPGLNATFAVAYHEGDDKYENHICGVMSRLYKHPLVFLGMWHRHPGSLDVFSGTDDSTNYKYTQSAGNGCISALINIDPELRITFYYVEPGRNEGVVYYSKVDVEIGDDKFENAEILKFADPKDIVRRSTGGRI